MMEIAKISVRKAELSDIPTLNETMRLSKAHWGYDQPFLDAFMERLGIHEDYLVQHHVNILCHDTEFMGFFSFLFQEDGTLELDHFFLHPSYIGKGYGKHLWNESILFAAKLQAKEFVLWSDPYAESFYAKMGCKKIGVRKSPFMPNRFPPIMHFTLPLSFYSKN